MLRAIEIDLKATITVKKIMNQLSMYILSTVAPEQHKGLGHCPCTYNATNMSTTFDSPDTLQLSFSIHKGIGSKIPPSPNGY